MSSDGSARPVEESLDHLIVFSERHLMCVMGEYVRYSLESRTHLGLGKGSREGRPAEAPPAGSIRSRLEAGGLHRRYYREVA